MEASPVQAAIHRQTYPQPPWRLRANVCVSFWRPSLAELRALLPLDIRPFAARGHGLAAVASIAYQPGGDLQYQELLFAVLVRAHGGLCVHVPFIWVDSCPALEGGRTLWAIPKQLATFACGPRTTLVSDANGTLARVQWRRRATVVPIRLPLRLKVAQATAGELRITRLLAHSRIAWADARWDFPHGSPLAFLQPLRPFTTIELPLADLLVGV